MIGSFIVIFMGIICVLYVLMKDEIAKRKILSDDIINYKINLIKNCINKYNEKMLFTMQVNIEKGDDYHIVNVVIINEITQIAFLKIDVNEYDIEYFTSHFNYIDNNINVQIRKINELKNVNKDLFNKINKKWISRNKNVVIYFKRYVSLIPGWD
jgi:hypothetical protein